MIIVYPDKVVIFDKRNSCFTKIACLLLGKSPRIRFCIEQTKRNSGITAKWRYCCILHNNFRFVRPTEKRDDSWIFSIFWWFLLFLLRYPYIIPGHPIQCFSTFNSSDPIPVDSPPSLLVILSLLFFFSIFTGSLFAMIISFISLVVYILFLCIIYILY